jgi:hypothetical protein
VDLEPSGTSQGGRSRRDAREDHRTRCGNQSWQSARGHNSCITRHGNSHEERKDAEGRDEAAHEKQGDRSREKDPPSRDSFDSRFGAAGRREAPHHLLIPAF